jgi:hypothetical protein
LKLIKGSYFDTEFDNIATAVATKYDSADVASQAQAEAGTANTVLMTPLRTEQWSATWAAENGGMIANIQALADPGADSFLIWDNSATDAVAMPLASESGLAISATPDVKIDISSLSSSLTGATIAGADLLLVDDGAGGTNKKIAYQDFGVPVTVDTTATPFSSIDLTYANRLFTCNFATAVTATIPANATLAFPVGTVIGLTQLGAGQVTVAVTTDTLSAPIGAKTRTQYSTIFVTKVATTTWVVSGDAAA